MAHEKQRTSYIYIIIKRLPGVINAPGAMLRQQGPPLQHPLCDVLRGSVLLCAGVLRWNVVHPHCAGLLSRTGSGCAQTLAKGGRCRRKESLLIAAVAPGIMHAVAVAIGHGRGGGYGRAGRGLALAAVNAHGLPASSHEGDLQPQPKVSRDGGIDRGQPGRWTLTPQ